MSRPSVINVRSNFETPFKEFINALSQGNILSTNKKSAPSFKDKKAFMNLGKGLFIAYLVAGIRQTNSSYCFLKVNNHRTLMIVNPIDIPLVPLSSRAKMTGLYIDNVQNGFEIEDCHDNGIACSFEAFLAYNASHLSNRSYMRRAFRTAKASNGSCSKTASAWLKDLYDKKNDSALQSLGGYVIRLDVNPKVFQYLFSVVDVDEESNFSIAEKNFNMFLTTYLGIEFNAHIAKPEAYLERSNQGSIYKTYETDGIIVADNDMTKLIALETTLGIPDKEKDFISQFMSGLSKSDKKALQMSFAQLKKDHHFKQKYITHTTLRNLNFLNYRYIYCVLGDLIFDDQCYKNSYSTMASKDPDFHLLTLGKQGRKLVINLRNNWWDPQEIESMYDLFINNLRTIAKPVLGLGKGSVGRVSAKASSACSRKI